MCKDRRAPCEAALQRILKIEQAQVILTPLANDDLRAALDRVGKDALGFAIELALECLGVCRNPHRAVCLARPERGWRKIAQGLADPGSRFGEQHRRATHGRSRIEDASGGARVIALTFAFFGALASEFGESVERLVFVEPDRARCKARRAILPFG